VTFQIPQTHHGISCSDINKTKAILRVLGFTEFQPNAPEPLIYKNHADDYIGQVTAPVLGDEYHTHYVENPKTGQQIDLIEIQPEALTPRNWTEPAQGDLVIGFPVDDPHAMYAAMQTLDPDTKFSDPVEDVNENGLRFTWTDGQHSILTRNPEPFAILHYSAIDFPIARKFYEEVVEISIKPLPQREEGVDRYVFADAGGRLEIEVRADTHRLDFRAWGKHYASANHFRLVGRDIARIEKLIAETGMGGWVIPPENGFAFVHGPTSETFEAFDAAFGMQATKAAE
jgi:hypothetical protein